MTAAASDAGADGSASAGPPPLGGVELDEESLRPFVMALGAFAGLIVVATLVSLMSRPLGARFARRHPVMAEILNVGRH